MAKFLDKEKLPLAKVEEKRRRHGAEVFARPPPDKSMVFVATFEGEIVQNCRHIKNPYHVYIKLFSFFDLAFLDFGVLKLDDGSARIQDVGAMNPGFGAGRGQYVPLDDVFTHMLRDAQFPVQVPARFILAPQVA